MGGRIRRKLLDEHLSSIGPRQSETLICPLCERPIPPAQRDAWRALFNHYIFEANADTAAAPRATSTRAARRCLHQSWCPDPLRVLTIPSARCCSATTRRR